MNTVLWIVAYVAIVNLAGFTMMGMDKARAKKHAWRISEAALFFVAIIGGSFGSTVGMYTFRHKTKHWYFKWGMPLIMAIQLILVFFLIKHPGFNISIM